VPQFVAGDAPECAVEAFVFLDPPAGHEPEAVGRPVDAQAQQGLATAVSHHQVDRHQRRRRHDRIEGR